MKKFYSIVLMATALLIGTNAWATTTLTLGDEASGATYRTLRAAIAAAQEQNLTEVKIDLLSPLSDPNTVWLGTEKVTDVPMHVIFDLKTNTYENTAASLVAIAITHGTLEIQSTGGEGEIKTASATADFVRVYGTYLAINAKDEAPFSHLIVGVGVKLSSSKLNAIGVDVIREAEYTSFGWASNPLKYSCRFFDTAASSKDEGHGVANGARVDVFGKVESSSKYALKVNGCIRSGNEFAGKAGFPIYRAGLAPSEFSIQDSAKLDYSPYIYVHAGGELKTAANATKAVAAYSSGYGRWMIEGKCSGSTGVYVKSGTVEIGGFAEILSTADVHNTPETGKGAGVNAGGSAIVIDSESGTYSGDIQVNITGNATITGAGGYAIEETVKPGAPSEVETINIEGGTFNGGSAGAIIVTDQSEKNVTVYGGNVSGDVEAGTTGGLLDLLPKDEGGDATAYITSYTDPETGKVQLVVTTGDEPAPVVDAFDINTFTVGDVNLSEGTLANKNQIFNDATVTELNIGTLTMNNATDSVKLTIAAGHTIIAQRVLLGYKAQIIVQPGASLIVTGKQGITTVTPSNIILQADNLNQATFLFNPEVVTNSNPYATVVLTAKQIGKLGNAYAWHRFAMPIQHASTWKKEGNLTGTTYPTYLYGWDYATNDWLKLSGGVSDMVPFAGYTLTLASDEITGVTERQDVRYIFEGQLIGNSNSSLNFQRSGYHYFGNSYTSHISILKLVNDVLGNEGLEGTVWVWNATNQRYEEVPLGALNDYPEDYADYQKEVAPMHTFLLKQAVGGVNSTDLNYASAVWGNPRYDAVRPAPQAAPARRMSMNNATMRLIITAANGQSDAVRFVENDNRSDAFDNGYDASKYMEENIINAYVTINDEKLGTVATNNLEGKLVNFTTNDEIAYTLSFSNVSGEEYAIRDNVTGAIVTIEEGATYDFSAQPNAVIEGRFEIVGRQNMPTAIDNTEAVKSAKGIYTIMGQYVGEDFEVLPAGIYVVNGVKIVK